MAIQSNYLYSDSFAKRNIIQIDSLPKEDSETYFLLSKLLTYYPKVENKDEFSSLADLNIRFSLSSRGDKYVMFSTLEQVEHPALRYIFTNPYNKGVEIEINIINSGFKVDNVTFENLKASLIYQTKQENKKAIHLLKASLSTLYSTPYLSIEKLSNISASNVIKAYETYRDNKSGELLYFGKALSKELPPLNKYEKPLDILSSAFILTGYNTIYEKEVLDEAAAYIFEVPTLKTIKEMDVLETFLRSLSLMYKDYSFNYLGTETSVSIDYIDASHPVLLVSTLKNKGEYLAKQGILSLDKPLSEKHKDYFEEASLYNEEKKLNLQMNENLTLKRFLLVHAFGLTGEDFLDVGQDDKLLSIYSENISLKAIVCCLGGVS